MKVMKLTNPLYIGEIAPLILSFYNKVKKTSEYEGISYETLHAYLVQAIQFGGDFNEVWVALDDKDVPVGFAKWHVCGLPHFGKVYVEFLYSKLKDKIVSVELIKEFVKFGEKNRASWYSFDAVNPNVAKALMRISEEVGVHSKETGIVNFIGRKAKV
jgi:hypothetical protein